MQTISKKQSWFISIIVALTIFLFLAFPVPTNAQSLKRSSNAPALKSNVSSNFFTKKPLALFECLNISIKTVSKTTVYHQSPPGGATRATIAVTVGSTGCGSPLQHGGVTISISETCAGNGRSITFGPYSIDIGAGYDDGVTATDNWYCGVLQNGKIVAAVVPTTLIASVDSNGLLSDNDIAYAPTTTHII